MSAPAMATRAHTHEIELAARPEDVFALLVTPSAIRGWWSAARAVVIPRAGGTWAAAWGADEDRPEYVTVASIEVYEPPRRLVLADYRCAPRSGPLPFEADVSTEFTVERAPAGARLRVRQDGFPVDAVADEFYRGCERGWRDTFDGIRRYLASRRS